MSGSTFQAEGIK